MPGHRNNPQTILITGASGGIGRALALAYAGPGRTLYLSGRDRLRLDSAAAACQESGAKAEAAAIDVQDRASMARWIAECDARHPLDLVVANAGISAGTGGAKGEDDEQVREIFSINLAGVLNTVSPAVAVMTERGEGQIAIVSSIASFRGLPGAPAYSASKAAVRLYGEALRGQLFRHGIKVSVICPGFVESRITENNAFPMPLLMSADKAARIIRRGLKRNKARIAFPWPIYWAGRLLGCLPPAWTDALLRRLPRKI